MRATPPERIAEARKLRDRGNTVYEIAVLMGVTVGSVKGMLYPRSKEKRVEQKFCKDCKHYELKVDRTVGAPSCRHPLNYKLDYVDGTRYPRGDCWAARRKWCGKSDPRGWEAK